MPKVDILVPCYNYGRYLRACVSSILDQSVQDLRVLIIDDFSTDDTAAVANELAQADHRVSVVSHAENWGHIRTYNEGIAWASADYFMLLSADDLLMPGALRRAIAVLDEHPDVVLTYGGWIGWNGVSPIPDVGNQGDCVWSRREGIELIREFCSSGENSIRTPSVIARTAVQKAVGGYCSCLPHSGDMEMWLRFAARGAIAHTNAVQAIYRQHASNMSHSYFADYRERKAAFDSFFAAYTNDRPHLQSLQAQAYRILAARAFWTGVAQICRGNGKTGSDLISFATGLNPRLRYRPPLGLIAREPDLYKRLSNVLRDGVKNLLKHGTSGNRQT